MDIQTNMPARTGPKEFFMHLLTFGLLYVFAVSFITLWWQIINIKFPDQLLYYTSGFDQLRWPIAILVVVFPIYAILARMATRAIVADPAKKDLRIYRWLVYLTLFITAVTVIIDLISLLYSFLGGELTTRFGLKVLVILVVSVGIFGYYLWHLRSDVAQTGKGRHILLWSSVAVVLASIVFAFVIVGSPATARAQRFDQQRINDLQKIEFAVNRYYSMYSELPNSMQDLKKISDFTEPLDPRPGQEYERHYAYLKDTKTNFRLCARFSQESPNQPETNQWHHKAGELCFTRIVNSDFYVPKPVR